MLFTEIMIRHDVSMQNTDKVNTKYIGDQFTPLDPTNIGTLARQAGAKVGKKKLRKGLVYASPYTRTRQTFAYALIGAGLAEESDLADFANLPELALAANAANKKLIDGHQEGTRLVDIALDARDIQLPEFDALASACRRLGTRVAEMADKAGVTYFEDVRLIEVNHGLGDIDHQQLFKRVHSSLLYRFSDGGESGLDAWMRIDSFLESLYRQLERKDKKLVCVFGHGMTMRYHVARSLHLKMEEFERISNPKNCDIITIAPLKKLKKLNEQPQFVSGRYGVIGLKVYPEVD